MFAMTFCTRATTAASMVPISISYRTACPSTLSYPRQMAFMKTYPTRLPSTGIVTTRRRGCIAPTKAGPSPGHSEPTGVVRAIVAVYPASASLGFVGNLRNTRRHRPFDPQVLPSTRGSMPHARERAPLREFRIRASENPTRHRAVRHLSLVFPTASLPARQLQPSVFTRLWAIRKLSG